MKSLTRWDITTQHCQWCSISTRRCKHKQRYKEMCKKISLHTTMTITRSHLSTYFFISHYYAQWDAIIMHNETMMYRSLSPELFRSPRSKTWVHLTGSLSGAGWGVGPSWGSLSRPCRAQLDRCSFLAQVESYITMLMLIYLPTENTTNPMKWLILVCEY